MRDEMIRMNKTKNLKRDERMKCKHLIVRFERVMPDKGEVCRKVGFFLLNAVMKIVQTTSLLRKISSVVKTMKEAIRKWLKRVMNKKKVYSLMINIGLCLIGLSILTLFGLAPFYAHLSAETFVVTYLILFEVFFLIGFCLLFYGTEKREEERSYRELVEVPKSWFVTLDYWSDLVEEGNKK